MAMNNKETRKVFGAFEIARLFHVTPITVNRWIKEGKLPSFKTAGGHYRVWEKDVMALMRSLNIASYRKFGKGGPLKILIVEDNTAARRLIRRLIEKKFPRAEIHEAIDGYEAGFKTRALQPSLVILDLSLPSINGARVCRMIRRDPDLKGVSILAISGHVIEKAKRVILKAGADDFLPKPFENDALIERVRLLLIP